MYIHTYDVAKIKICTRIVILGGLYMYMYIQYSTYRGVRSLPILSLYVLVQHTAKLKGFVTIERSTCVNYKLCLHQITE